MDQDQITPTNQHTPLSLSQADLSLSQLLCLFPVVFSFYFRQFRTLTNLTAICFLKLPVSVDYVLDFFIFMIYDLGIQRLDTDP